MYAWQAKIFESKISVIFFSILWTFTTYFSIQIPSLPFTLFLIACEKKSSYSSLFRCHIKVFSSILNPLFSQVISNHTFPRHSRCRLSCSVRIKNIIIILPLWQFLYMCKKHMSCINRLSHIITVIINANESPTSSLRIKKLCKEWKFQFHWTFI